MAIFLKIILKASLVALILALAYGFFRTWKTGRSPMHVSFASGSVPKEMPLGLYRGFADELGEVSWKGKKFNEGGAGINLFQTEGKSEEKYRFTIYPAKSLRGNQQVLRIDYDQPGNPLWLRFIVDEMVIVAPGQFLGAVYINLAPGFRFCMGYFRLEKE